MAKHHTLKKSATSNNLAVSFLNISLYDAALVSSNHYRYRNNTRNDELTTEEVTRFNNDIISRLHGNNDNWEEVNDETVTFLKQEIFKSELSS